MIQAAFFDVDGTLLSHKTNTVPQSAVHALEQLRRRGIRIFTATGRHIRELDKLHPLRGLRFDGAVTLNGQYCRDDGGVIYDCPIHSSDVAAILSFLKDHSFPCIFVEEESMYINFHNQRVAEVQAAIHSEMPAPGDLNRGYDHPIYQIILYMDDTELKLLPELPHVRITRWHSGGVDLIPADGGKAAGIAKVLEHYGLTREEAIAFGDGHNDVDMFRAVGTAVAMGNACQAAKDAADYITDDPDNDGVWNALKHFGVL